jgi:shikimate 5-dehydrogenase
MAALTQLLIGHRGVGKTTFLRGLEAWSRAHGEVRAFYDLDHEIEQRSGKTIAQLIAAGESEFRTLEHKILIELVRSTPLPTVIAVGAGFEEPLPPEAHVLWMRRATDAHGRCFLNRPRLDPALSPLSEYMERFAVRERRFQDWAHEELLLPEGYESGLESLFFANPSFAPFALTLLPENFRAWDAFFAKRRDWNVRWWEIRDDLLTEEQIARALSSLPRERVLFSRRKPGPLPEGRADWALELGPPPASPHVISLHERAEDFTATLARLGSFASQAEILKLAVEVKDFFELEAGHRWWMQDPVRRSFLPRSHDGRWRWYRSLFGPRMPLHFLREGTGSAPDQPPLWQALLQPTFRDHFAAVLGSPVEHSRTPMEQRRFFADHGWPVVAVDVPEAEFSAATRFLVHLGLRAAAVTAPLKKLAWACSDRVSSEARQMQAANTLSWAGGRVHAHNTDVLALAQCRARLPSYKNVWLWGGGGVKSSVLSVWPEAIEISARQGEPSASAPPDVLIWATGRHRHFRWPATGVRPQLVFDLNYGEDSPGLEWAVRENLPYQSGLTMFKLQAAFQREFWQAEWEGEAR